MQKVDLAFPLPQPLGGFWAIGHPGTLLRGWGRGKEEGEKLSLRAGVGLGVPEPARRPVPSGSQVAGHPGASRMPNGWKEGELWLAPRG